jgi:hypothetical protein
LEHIPVSSIDAVLSSFRDTADWGMFTVGCRENSKQRFWDGDDKTHQTYFLKSWWVQTLLEYGEIYWDLMEEFAYKVRPKEPAINWGRRFFVVEWK